MTLPQTRRLAVTATSLWQLQHRLLSSNTSLTVLTLCGNFYTGSSRKTIALCILSFHLVWSGMRFRAKSYIQYSTKAQRIPFLLPFLWYDEAGGIKWVEFAVLFAVSLIDAEHYLCYCTFPKWTVSVSDLMLMRPSLLALSFHYCVSWKVGNVPENCCSDKRHSVTRDQWSVFYFPSIRWFSHFNLRQWSV